MSTSVFRKPAYHHGDLRAAMLRSAGEILEKQGVEALSARAAARRAGVSHSAPYRHFPDRDALLAALAAQGFARLGDALQEAARRGGKEMGEAYVRFALAHPQRFRLMFGGRIALRRHPELGTQAERAHAALVAAFSRYAGSAEPAHAAAAAWALVHGLSQLLLDGHFAQATAGGRETVPFVRDVIGSVRFVIRGQRSA